MSFFMAKTELLLSHTEQKSTMVEGLCNSGSIQNVARITDHCIETNYNEPCDNAFQPALDRFFCWSNGNIFSFRRMSERPTSSQPETFPCFSAHPRKRIGRNGVSSSPAPSAHQINYRKLPAKSSECYSCHILQSYWQYVLKEHRCDLNASRAKLLSRCPLPPRRPDAVGENEGNNPTGNIKLLQLSSKDPK